MAEETWIKVLEQKIEINDITDVVVTSIEADTDGSYVREIRLTGSYATGVSGNPRSLVIRINGATAEAIEITTPELDF